MITPPRHLASAIIAGLCALLLAACGPTSYTVDEHIDRAQQAHAEGDLRAAIIEIKNALQQEPSRAEARRLLGLYNLEIGDPAGAESELQRARELGHDPDEVKIPLMRAWLQLGQPERIMEATRHIEDFPESLLAEALSLRGLAMLARGNFEEAEQVLRDALDRNGALVDAQIGMTFVAFSVDSDPDAARSWLEKALQTDPESAQAWGLLGDLEQVLGHAREAEAAYSEAIKHAIHPYVFHLKRFMARMAMEDTEAAERDLKTLQRMGPQAATTSYVEGLLHYHRGRYQDAQVALEETLSRAPSFQSAMFYLGASHLAQAHWQQAEQHLRRFLAANPGSDEAQRLLTLAQARESGPAGAASPLRTFAERVPQYSVALDQGSGIGLEQLRQVAVASPQGMDDDAVSGDGLAGPGTFMELPDEQAREAAQIVALIQQGRFEDALELVAELQARLPDDPLAYNLRAAVYLAQNELTQGAEALREALRVSPGNPSASLTLAQIALLEEDFAEARELYNQSLRQHPTHLRVLLQFAQLEAHQGNESAMAGLLERAVRAHPEELQPRLMLGRYHLRRNEPQQTLALLEPLADTRQADNPYRLELLVGAQLATGQTEKAVENLHKLARTEPRNAEARFRLGAGFAQAREDDEARAQLRQALELDPDHLGALHVLAGLEAESGATEEALALARRMQAAAPNVADGHRLEAEILADAGRQDEALEPLDRAYQLSPNAQNAIALARAYRETGHPQEAMDLMREHLAVYPSDEAVRALLAQTMQEQGERDAAIREYEQLAETFPDNFAVLNNLANLYQQQGDLRALELAERAHALQPDNPAVADTLGWILVQQGEVDRGLELLEQARQALPDHAEVRYHYAAALAKQGATAQARRELSALLDEDTDFPQRAEAERLLEDLE